MSRKNFDLSRHVCNNQFKISEKIISHIENDSSNFSDLEYFLKCVEEIGNPTLIAFLKMQLKSIFESPKDETSNLNQEKYPYGKNRHNQNQLRQLFSSFFQCEHNKYPPNFIYYVLFISFVSNNISQGRGRDECYYLGLIDYFEWVLRVIYKEWKYQNDSFK